MIADFIMSLLLRLCSFFMSKDGRKDLHKHLAASFQRKYDPDRAEDLVERTRGLLRV